LRRPRVGKDGVFFLLLDVVRGPVVGEFIAVPPPIRVYLCNLRVRP
jgi:hypothetical protein